MVFWGKDPIIFFEVYTPEDLKMEHKKWRFGLEDFPFSSK